MTKLGYSIFISGLLALAPSARASLTFYCGSGCAAPSSQFTTDAGTAGLAITSVVSFSNTNITGDEYTDPSLVDFFSFTESGSGASGTVGSASPFRDPTGSNATLAPHALLEISLPANVFAFSLDITEVIGSTSTTFCIEAETAFSGSDCNAQLAQDQQVTVTSVSNSQFIGVISTTALTTLWIGALNGSGILDVEDFSFGTQSGSQSDTAPDPATMLTLGSGLILLALLRRRTRLFRFLNR